MSAPAADSRLVIERLNATYVVPDSHPRPDSVRLRLDPVLRDNVPALCARMLGQAFEAQDPSIWLIRRLDVDLALDVGAADDALVTRAWSERLAHGITRTVLRGADGDNVLYFPDRAAYLAQFAHDLARGQAWEHWYYHSLDGLRYLPTTAALREAFLREPAFALPMLDTLAQTNRLKPVLAGLTQDDAARVFAACTASGAAVARDPRTLIESILDVWDAVLDEEERTRSNSHRALLVLSALRVRTPQLTRDGRIGAAIQHFLGFVDLLGQVGTDTAFRDALAARDLAGAIVAARSRGINEGLAHLVYLNEGMSGDFQRLAQLTPAAPSPAERDDAFTNVRVTAFGGMFFLLPALGAGLANLLESLWGQAAGDVNMVSMARYLIAVKSMGRARAPHTLTDPVLAMALGLDAVPLPHMLRAAWDALGAVSPNTVSDALRDLFVTQGQASGRWLSIHVLSMPADAQVLLVRDLEHDTWLAAEPIADSADKAVEDALGRVQNACGIAAEMMLFDDPTLAEHYAREQALTVVCLEPFDGATRVDFGANTDAPLTVWTTKATLDEGLRRALDRERRRTNRLQDELDYFTLAEFSPPVAPQTVLDLTLTLAARVLLKTFAARLMGFQDSSPEHLYQNFLAGSATVYETRDVLRAEIAPRPLQLILNLAGYHERHYQLPWLARPLELLLS